MSVTAFKNSTRHFNMNNGMSPHTVYPHVLICLCQCISIRHVLTQAANRRMSSTCEDAVRDHKRYAKWHEMKQAVIVLSDDDDEDDVASTKPDEVASASPKVPPHPPMFPHPLQPACCRHCQRI